RLWNIRTGETLRTFPGHPAPVLALALTATGNRLATVGADNTIRLWDLESGQVLATLVPLPAETLLRDPSDWLAVTPEGYYDGSANAGRHIHWRIGTHLYSVEAFEQKMHRPEQLRKALDPLAQPAGAGAGNNLPPPAPALPLMMGVPPEITFNTPQENETVMGSRVSVKLTVTATSKVNQVEILANGRPLGAKPIEIGAKPIEIGAKPIEIGAKPLPSGHKSLQQFQMEVTLPPGDPQVVLTARVTDVDGLLAREELRLNRAGTGAANGNLYVLAVGISHYKNPKYNLKFAAADAAAFGALWKGQGGGLYQKVEVTQLTDAQATSASIRAAFEQLQNAATSADSVAIFLSGHGVQANANDYYFAAQDIDASSLESVKQTGLPWTVLQTTLSALKARRVFMFLDACHSGNALGGQQSSNERMAELLVKQGGVMVFSSSRGSEYSYELEDLQHGAFTAAILEGIGQGKADFDIGGQRDGTITAEELLAYLRARVPQLTGNMQTPTCPLLRDFGEASPLAKTK
ncbi:MAG TPA: caspase family protein, partial [Chthonomonadaceae bacterium]|nr:caspase family protein [Chthonomonadaceae bacterium]